MRIKKPKYPSSETTNGIEKDLFEIRRSISDSLFVIALNNLDRKLHVMEAEDAVEHADDYAATARLLVSDAYQRIEKAISLVRYAAAGNKDRGLEMEAAELLRQQIK